MPNFLPDPFSLLVLSLQPGDAVASLSTLTGIPDGTLVYVPASRLYFQLNTGSVATPNGTTIIAASGGGNWLAFAAAGVDGSGNVTPNTLTWPATATPQLTEATQTSDVATNSITLAPQPAFASATGTNRTPGSVIVNVAAPTNGSNAEAALIVEHAGVKTVWIGQGNGLANSGQISFGPSADGSNGGTFILENASSLFLNSGGGTVRCEVSGTAVLDCNASNISCYQVVQGGTSGNAFKWGQSAVTFAATGSTVLSAAQQQTPLIVLSVVTLTGGVTLDFGGVIGNWVVDFSQVTVGAQTVTLKNGAGTFVITSLLSASKNLVTVSCRTAALVAAG